MAGGLTRQGTGAGASFRQRLRTPCGREEERCAIPRPIRPMPPFPPRLRPILTILLLASLSLGAAAPRLTAPADGATLHSPHPQFHWQPEPGPATGATHRVVLARESAFSNVVCADDLLFSIDRRLFRKALEAMLDNSAMMRSPERMLEVEVSAEVSGKNGVRWLRISVRDNGAGVVPGMEDIIFQRGVSLRPNAPPSTGLGLNEVRRVARGHGGSVSVSTSNGHGATFVIEIPEFS